MDATATAPSPAATAGSLRYLSAASAALSAMPSFSLISCESN